MKELGVLISPIYEKPDAFIVYYNGEESYRKEYDESANGFNGELSKLMVNGWILISVNIFKDKLYAYLTKGH